MSHPYLIGTKVKGVYTRTLSSGVRYYVYYAPSIKISVDQLTFRHPESAWGFTWDETEVPDYANEDFEGVLSWYE